MNALLSFYRGESTNPEGRKLEDIWIWQRDRLENVHNYIQWLFLLPEPSRFNSTAPLLNEEVTQAFFLTKNFRSAYFAPSN